MFLLIDAYEHTAVCIVCLQNQHTHSKRVMVTTYTLKRVMNTNTL
jgi:hypothetical protein